MADTHKISVSFEVELNLAEIVASKQRLDKLRPGTTEYCATYDKLKLLHQQFVERLEGECRAYVNIAKEQGKRLFFSDLR